MTDREKAHQIAALYKKAKQEKKVPSSPSVLLLLPSCLCHSVSISTLSSVHLIRYCNSSYAISERSNTSWLNALITANEFLMEKVPSRSIDIDGLSCTNNLLTLVNDFQAAARSATSILDKRRRSALRSAWRRNSRGNIRQGNARCLCRHYLNFDQIEVTVTCPNPNRRALNQLSHVLLCCFSLSLLCRLRVCMHFLTRLSEKEETGHP